MPRLRRIPDRVGGGAAGCAGAAGGAGAPTGAGAGSGAGAVGGAAVAMVIPMHTNVELRKARRRTSPLRQGTGWTAN